jgi:hypothetical protein
LEDWRVHPVAYKKWKDTTSENYLTALPSFLAKRVRLVDNVTVRNQLVSLERRPGAGDKETVSHPEHGGAHDDVAAAVCGAVALAQCVTRWAADTPNVHVPIWGGVPRNIPGQNYGVGASEMSLPVATAPATGGLLTDSEPEPWRSWVSGGAYYDRWSNRN